MKVSVIGSRLMGRESNPELQKEASTHGGSRRAAIAVLVASGLAHAGLFLGLLFVLTGSHGLYLSYVFQRWGQGVLLGVWVCGELALFGIGLWHVLSRKAWSFAPLIFPLLAAALVPYFQRSGLHVTDTSIILGVSWFGQLVTAVLLSGAAGIYAAGALAHSPRIGSNRTLLALLGTGLLAWLVIVALSWKAAGAHTVWLSAAFWLGLLVTCGSAAALTGGSEPGSMGKRNTLLSGVSFLASQVVFLAVLQLAPMTRTLAGDARDARRTAFAALDAAHWAVSLWPALALMTAGVVVAVYLFKPEVGSFKRAGAGLSLVVLASMAVCIPPYIILRDTLRGWTTAMLRDLPPGFSSIGVPVGRHDQGPESQGPRLLLAKSGAFLEPINATKWERIASADELNGPDCNSVIRRQIFSLGGTLEVTAGEGTTFRLMACIVLAQRYASDGVIHPLHKTRFGYSISGKGGAAPPIEWYVRGPGRRLPEPFESPAYTDTRLPLHTALAKAPNWIRLDAAAWTYSIGKRHGKLVGSAPERLAALRKFVASALGAGYLDISASPSVPAADVLRVASVAGPHAMLRVLDPSPPTVQLTVSADPSPGVAWRDTQDAVKKVLMRRLETFRQCYLAGLARNPELQGQIALDFEVSTDGSPAHVSSSSQESPRDVARDFGQIANLNGRYSPVPRKSADTVQKDAAVLACVERGVQGATFPTPDEATRVTAFFVFWPGA